MKTSLLAVAVALFCVATVRAGEGAWLTDFPKAQAQAAAEKKPLLLDFTGSDWCSWCIKFDKEVLSTPEFQKYAADNLVLVKLDFPQQKPQPAAEKEQNEGLAKKYGVQGFPTFLLLSADGKVLFTQAGYAEGGPQAFIKQLAAAKK